ncbi:PHP domain-containing protein [Candidatus Woesearchaeota archaeon]|nr:PHP domain-containing protein [Candidatus Woesearchaeota archaeon]
MMREFRLQIIIVVFLVVLISGCAQRPKTFSGDLHIHTAASFDSTESYESVIEQAVKNHLEFIAITDHNVIDAAIAQKCRQEKRLLCIVGEEITNKEDHILAIDISKKISASLSNQKVIEQIRKQGGLAIAAHPLPENGGLTLAEIQTLLPDAMECASLRLEDTDYMEKLQEAAARMNIPCIYDSDAHSSVQLGMIVSSCQMKELSVEEIKVAVKKGRCSRRQ